MTFFYDLNKKLAGITDKAESKQLNEGAKPAVAEASASDYSAKKARAGKDIGKPGKQFAKIAKSAGEKYGSKERGEKVAGAVLAKLRGVKEGEIPKHLQGPKKSDIPAYRRTPLTLQDIEDEKYRNISHRDTLARNSGRKPAPPVQKEEGGAPMTAKQKSFAKLAPPKDKITFADKIAGAKKEVDEVLGQVAADAMKKAVSGHGTNKARSTDEGWDDMMAAVKARADKPKVGSVERGHKHDIEHTATGRRVTRRTDDQGISVGADDDSDTPPVKRGRGRPKKSDAPRQERVTAKSRKADRTSWSKKKTTEGADDVTDQGEYDQEGEMAKDDIKTIVRHAQALEKVLGDNDNLPEWVQAKLAKIEGMMTAVDDYMQNQTGDDEEEPIAEKAVSKKQQRFMGMVHAAQKGEKPASKEVAKVAKSMPKKEAEKFAKTKHKGLPEKAAKKKEEVEETTVSGSVAPAAEAPKGKGKGGFTFGKGIYDSINREVEGIIAESMNVSMNMSNDANGGPTKSLTVTATDDDAVHLAQLLRMAGMGGGSSCGCGQTPCACNDAEKVDENQPDWPTNTESSDDALQYSGGLNKPKTTVAGDGQTTVPVTAVQVREEEQLDEEQCNECGMYESKCSCSEDVAESLSRIRNLAGIAEAKKVEEDDVEEGNKFTGNLAKARAAGKKEADLDGDGDLEKVRESMNSLWKAYKG